MGIFSSINKKIEKKREEQYKEKKIGVLKKEFLGVNELEVLSPVLYDLIESEVKGAFSPFEESVGYISFTFFEANNSDKNYCQMKFYDKRLREKTIQRLEDEDTDYYFYNDYPSEEPKYSGARDTDDTWCRIITTTPNIILHVYGVAVAASNRNIDLIECLNDIRNNHKGTKYACKYFDLSNKDLEFVGSFFTDSYPSKFDKRRKNLLQTFLTSYEDIEKLNTVINDLYDLNNDVDEYLRDKYLDENRKLIENFTKKYGVGNYDQIETLEKSLNQEGIDVKGDELKHLVSIVNDELIKNEIKNNLGETEDFNEICKRFLDVFENYNEKSIRILAEVTDRSFYNTKKDLEKLDKKLKTDKEINKFKEELKSSKDVKIKKRISKSDLVGDIDKIDGEELEKLISDLFEAKGHDAEITKGSGDQGADVIVNKGSNKIVIQAKRYSDKVSNSAVQEIVASKKYYNASRGLVITNSEFTPSAKELAKSNEVELWNGDKLIRQIERYLD